MTVISSKIEDDRSVVCNGLKYFLKDHLYFLETTFLQEFFFLIFCTITA